RDCEPPIRCEHSPGTCAFLHGFPDPAGHAPADQRVSVAHRARLRVAPEPTELFRALTVTLAELFAGKWTTFILVPIRIILQSQLEWIHVQSDRQFVHSTFESEHAPGSARRSHVNGRVNVQRDNFL